jgi:lysophospholipase L1-like esterase
MKLLRILVSAWTLATITAAALLANTAAIPAPRDPLATPPDPHWMERHEGFVARAHRGSVPILFLGDSITDFWCADGPTRGGKAVWDRELAPQGAVNFGIGADRTQHVLWRIEHGELDGIAPRTVVLMIGTNNLGFERDHPKERRNTTAEAIQGITAVVNELRRRLPTARLILMALLPREGRDDPIRQQVAEVNTALAQLAKGDRIEFLDLGRLFLKQDGSIDPTLMPDLLHPSEKGYILWAGALRGRL